MNISHTMARLMAMAAAGAQTESAGNGAFTDPTKRDPRVSGMYVGYVPRGGGGDAKRKSQYISRRNAGRKNSRRGPSRASRKAARAKA